MDNAAKALILAGGLLIAIMIIGVALYILNNARDFAKSADSQARLNAVQSFNRYYESFLNSNGKVYGVDVLNIRNRSLDDTNERNNRVDVFVDSRLIEGLSAPTGAELMSKEYNCTFSYDLEGYISGITITE